MSGALEHKKGLWYSLQVCLDAESRERVGGKHERPSLPSLFKVFVFEDDDI